MAVFHFNHFHSCIEKHKARWGKKSEVVGEMEDACGDLKIDEELFKWKYTVRFFQMAMLLKQKEMRFNSCGIAT